MNTYCITDYGVTADSPLLQTAAIQAVFDRCRDEGGGTVLFPAGTYHAASLRLWSNMTLYFSAGACLLGSTECDDYEVYEVPEGVSLRTDMEMITQYYHNRPWKEYRRAMISAYGEKNISIIGERGAVIDGCDCFDPNGEEGFRGPHGIFLTNCENIRLKGYTIQNNGNFMHQLDNCRNTVMQEVTCLAGHDGIHLHCCVDTLIEDCCFRTGDDCIAGINVERLTVRRCEMNTSCDLFRFGGSHMLVEDCHMYGPGYYPHRMTIVRSKTECLPREAGRHNLICLLTHFASTNYPSPEDYHDVCFRRCTIENVGFVLHYFADQGPLQSGSYLREITFDQVTFRGVGGCSQIVASEAHPLTVRLHDVSADFADGCGDPRLFGDHPFTSVLSE